MQESANTQVVQQAYAAFGRGDSQALMNLVADDVVWKSIEGLSKQVPTAGVRHGKPAVTDFFRLVAESFTFSVFEPREFIAQGDRVVALGHYRSTTPVGGTFESDFVMVFNVKNGKICAFQEFANSAAINAAFEVGVRA